MTKQVPVYGLAARQPLAIAVLLVGLISGLTIFWWLLPLGVLMYLAMVWLVARDPVLVAAGRRPTRSSQISPTFRLQMDTIGRTSQEIQRSVTQGSGGAASRLLLRVGEQTGALVALANELCMRGQQIEQQLATKKTQPADASRQQGLIERIQMQLQHIAANLDNVLAETVRLRIADASSADNLIEQMATRLDALRGEVESFQQSLG
jgi:hypothetical protein